VLQLKLSCRFPHASKQFTTYAGLHPNISYSDCCNLPIAVLRMTNLSCDAVTSVVGPACPSFELFYWGLRLVYLRSSSGSLIHEMCSGEYPTTCRSHMCSNVLHVTITYCCRGESVRLRSVRSGRQGAQRSGRGRICGSTFSSRYKHTSERQDFEARCFSSCVGSVFGLHSIYVCFPSTRNLVT
jgi:hypothetical protein